MKFTDILTNSAHAYIVEGQTRKDFVNRFVKALNCEVEDISNRPCGACPSCRQIDVGTSMDVVYMEKSGKTSYMVKDASALIERLGMGSYGRHVIGVIEDADLLSETLQNKLLKTLEEPEPGAIIILGTANADNLLSTVRSRCNLIRVSDYEEGAESETLSSEGIEELAKFIISKHYYYELRDAIDKKVKTQEDAMLLLSSIEDMYHSELVNNRNMADGIDLVEKARMDIYMGMSYSKALKRLCLELS